jgi:hypothetical protein
MTDVLLRLGYVLLGAIVMPILLPVAGIVWLVTFLHDQGEQVVELVLEALADALTR